jgi:hypothetical protein
LKSAAAPADLNLAENGHQTQTYTLACLNSATACG